MEVCGVRGVGWGGVEAFGVKWFDNVELEGGASEGKRRWRRRWRRRTRWREKEGVGSRKGSRKGDRG